MQLNRQTLNERFDDTAVNAMRYAYNSSAIGATTFDRRGNLTTIEILCSEGAQTDFVILTSDAGSFAVTAEELF